MNAARLAAIASRAAPVAVAVLALRAAVDLAALCREADGLPLSDLADHGLAGLDVARALARLDLVAFLDALNRQVTWPFVHSLMLAPFFLALGDAYATAGAASVVLYAGTALLVFAAGTRLDPERGPWIGALAAAALLASPIYRIYGALPMLEMPGAFLLALAFTLHAAAGSGRAPPRLAAAAGLAATALFLCKYNYGLMWLAAVAIHEWLGLPRETRARALAAIRDRLPPRRRPSPFAIFMLVYLAALLAILATGGGVFHVLGRRVSIRSPGNPAYLFTVLLAGWALVRFARNRAGWRAAWSRLAARHRAYAATVALPLAAWFLIPYPNRVKEFFGFVINRDLGHPLLSVDGLLYYPRAFAGDYSPAGWIGVAALALAAWPPPRSAPRAPGRLLYAACAVGLLATVAHPYQDQRFLFTTAILVWLRAAQTAVAAVGWAIGRLRGGGLAREAAWGAGLAGVVAGAWWAAPPVESTRASLRGFFTPPAFGAVLDAVLDETSRAGGETCLLGYSNRLSPALLAWHAARTRPELDRRRLPARPPPAGGAVGGPALAARLERIRAAGRTVIAALPLPGSPLYSPVDRDEVRADSLAAARLLEDPRATVERRYALAAPGFTVAVTRPARGTEAAPER